MNLFSQFLLLLDKIVLILRRYSCNCLKSNNDCNTHIQSMLEAEAPMRTVFTP